MRAVLPLAKEEKNEERYITRVMIGYKSWDQILDEMRVLFYVFFQALQLWRVMPSLYLDPLTLKTKKNHNFLQFQGQGIEIET